MSSETPSRLFKYFGPDRVGILNNLQLRYTPLGAFNDPFEGRPEITSLCAPDELLAMMDELLPEETATLYQALPHETRAAISYEQVLQLMQRMARDKRDQLLSSMQSATPHVAMTLQSSFDELVGALCLSEIPDSILMWSHYAASHGGFVLEFDGRHSHFHEARSQKDEFRHLRRVRYRDTRPSTRLTAMDLVEMFLVKSSHWAYEREWRILRFLGDADASIPGNPFPIHLFSFPADALIGLIIGARATAETSDAVKGALQGNESLRHVRVRRATPDSTHFHLRLVDEVS